MCGSEEVLSSHSHTCLSYLVWGVVCFSRNGWRRKIQDLARCNVHRFYTPLALNSQWAEVPKHLLKGKGMLQSMQLKPFQIIKEGFFCGGPAILEWIKHFTFQMHIQIQADHRMYFFGQVTRQTIQPHKCLDVFNSRMADIKTDIH